MALTRTQKQIRYIGEGDPRNSKGASRASLIGGSLFDPTTRIVSLTLGGMIGFGFFINDTPSPLRILSNGDPTPDTETYRRFETFEFPQDVLSMSPIYNIKCEAASIDRMLEWNRNNPSNAEWLFIDYVEEVNL